MYVDIDTLNALGFEISADESDRIDLLVEEHERDYIDACLSVGLSLELTEETMQDARFTALSEPSVIDVCDTKIRFKGFSYGANYYIYYYFLLSKYKGVSDSGQTVMNPENSVQVDPTPNLNNIYNIASGVALETIYIITQDEDTYPEFSGSAGISERSSYNF